MSRRARVRPIRLSYPVQSFTIWAGPRRGYVDATRYLNGNGRPTARPRPLDAKACRRALNRRQPWDPGDPLTGIRVSAAGEVSDV